MDCTVFIVLQCNLNKWPLALKSDVKHFLFYSTKEMKLKFDRFDVDPNIRGAEYVHIFESIVIYFFFFDL